MFPCRNCLGISPNNRRCVRCRTVFYCNKECQKIDWSVSRHFEHPHKKQCRNEPPDESSSMEEALFKPSLCEEYSKVYPSERTHLRLLREKDLFFNSIAMKSKMADLRKIECIDSPVIYMRRWGASLLTYKEQLLIGDSSQIGQFLRSERRIYSEMLVLRNHIPQRLRYRFGHSYVAVGLVDLLQLMLGDFVDEEADCGAKEKITYVGYDSAAPQIARCQIIYQMMKDGASCSSVLQVWFSTALSEIANEDLLNACKRLIEEESVKDQEPAKLIKNLLQRKSLPLKDVQDLWKETDSVLFLKALSNANDRVAMSRYIYTGAAFVADGDIRYGNPTFMPALTQSKKDVSLFLAIENKFLAEYQGSLMDTVQAFLGAKVERLSELIQSKRVTCNFHQKYFTMEDGDLAREIRAMNPSAIDWSNLCDYFKLKDIAHYASSCSGFATVHTMHTMNWATRLVGASIVDYAHLEDYDVNEMLKVARRYLRIERQTEFKERPYLKKFLHRNAIVHVNMNAIDSVLAVYFGRFYGNIAANAFISVADELDVGFSFCSHGNDRLNEVVVDNNSTFDFAFSFNDGFNFSHTLLDSEKAIKYTIFSKDEVYAAHGKAA